MAHTVDKSMKVSVPSEKIWKVLKDFSSVEKFATTIQSSPIINGKLSGVGAKRKCTFMDGSSLIEEIVEYEEGRGYKMELSDYSLPLHFMNAEMWIKRIDSDNSELRMRSEFSVKGGLFGWLMGFLLMRPMMKAVFGKLLSGLAYYSETGREIGKNLPPRSELDQTVGSFH